MSRFGILGLAIFLYACGPDDGSVATAIGSKAAAASAEKAPTVSKAPAPPASLAGPTLPVPNHFVVFVLDDLSIADANFMQVGTVKRYTPTIDALAAQSVVLTNHHAVTPICTPSRFSMLTGTYPSRSTSKPFVQQLQQEGMPVPQFNALITDRDMTLPKRLRSLGYRTGFTGKDHVSDTDYGNIPNGSSITNSNVVKTLAKSELTVKQNLGKMGFDEVYSVFPTNVNEWPVVELQAHNLDAIVDGAINFIDKNYDKKFFLYVSLTVPHYPWNAARSWGADPRITPFGYLAQAPNVMPARSTLTPRVNAAGRPGDENFLWMDDAVAAVLGALQKRDLMSTTSIIVEGDHGMTAKGGIYRGGSWTPGFWYYRGVTGRTNELTSLIDLQPTLMNIAGAAPAGDGVSLLSLLNGTPGAVRPYLYTELGYARSILQGDYQYIALRHSKYIQSFAASKGYPLYHWLQSYGPHSLELEVQPKFPRFFDRDQLYDIKLDPLERNNLYGNPIYKPIVDQMAAEMQAEVNKLPGTVKIY